jgi:type III pantothenate kinase
VVVDIGNSRIKWGLCSDGHVQRMCSLPSDDPLAWEKQFLSWNVYPDADDATWVVAGVHPARMEAFIRWAHLEAFARPQRPRNSNWRIINSRNQIPVRVLVDFPEKVGLDRLFNAVAVNRCRPPGQPAVIVDAGSAVTVDYVDEEGRFQGGAIFPGLRLMAQALNANTAQLPTVEVKQRLRPPEKSTERAIELGVFHAVLGGIDLLIRALRDQASESLSIFFGGGDVGLLAPHLSWPVTIWPEMTLEGIRISGEQLC